MSEKYLSTNSPWDFEGGFDTNKPNWLCPENRFAFKCTGCVAIKWWKNDIPSNVSYQKNNATFTLKTFWDRQLCFYVKKLFVSEKIQKSELFHFSWKIYIIKFFALRTQTCARGAKFDDINLLRKMTKSTFLCFFTNK